MEEGRRRKYIPCFICHRFKGGGSRGRASSNNFGDVQSHNLSGQLSVIYALQKLFNVSTFICQTWIAKIGNPSEWFITCSECSSLIHESRILFAQLTDLQNKFNIVQGKIDANIQRSKERVFPKDANETPTTDQLEEIRRVILYGESQFTYIPEEVPTEDENKPVDNIEENAGVMNEKKEEIAIKSEEEEIAIKREKEEIVIKNEKVELLIKEEQLANEENENFDAFLNRSTVETEEMYSDNDNYEPCGDESYFTAANENTSDAENKRATLKRKVFNQSAEEMTGETVDSGGGAQVGTSFNSIDDNSSVNSAKNVKLIKQKQLRFMEDHPGLTICHMKEPSRRVLTRVKITMEDYNKKSIQLGRSTFQENFPKLTDMYEEITGVKTTTEVIEPESEEDNEELSDEDKKEEISSDEEGDDTSEESSDPDYDPNAEKIEAAKKLTKEIPDKVKPYACRHCDMRFTSYNTRSRHTSLKHIQEYNHACEICDEKFILRSGLKTHFKANHEGFKLSPWVRPPKMPHICEHCGKSCQHRSTLEHHIKFAHDPEDKKHFCELCSTKFISACALTHHRHHKHYLELNLEPYKCSFCGTIHSSPHALENHVKQQHTKEYKNFCEFCGGGFLTEGQLKHHIRSKHTGERPFPCPHCEKRFISKITLRNHVILHTGSYPSICQSCGKGFTTKYKLKHHISKHHPEYAETS